VATLGDTLREKRTGLGISLEEAEAQTRIRRRLLKALEEGEYEALPDPGYVRGYVSSYGRFLGLEPAALLQMYRAESGASPLAGLTLPQIGEAVPRTGEQHAVSWRAALAIVVAIALVSLGLWTIGRIRRGPQETPPEPVPATGVATESPTASMEVGTEEPLPEGTEVINAAVLPVTIVVRVAEDGASWVRVTIDGRKAYEGTLTGGQEKSYEVSGSATIRVGRPSAVTILRDGKAVRIPSGDTPTVKIDAAESAEE
jgi:transcriptional regulator with XRE-family HTH domain